jgi:glycosyltransferase involved in cell wall biosynthesis
MPDTGVVQSGLVSTIIPVFNRAALLCEAVASVLSQTYRPIEIIIVDDGSTDDTPQAIAALAAAHPEVRALRLDNGGPGLAREAGRSVAQGEFIQYLDSDDLLAPKKFELQVAGLNQHPECDVSYGMTRFYQIGDVPSNVAWKRTGDLIETMFPAFLESRWWDTSTPLYRRSVVDRAGPWLALRCEEDWEYDCRIARSAGPLHFVRSFVSDTRVHRSYMLSRRGRVPEVLQDQIIARELIFEHAKAAGVCIAESEMRNFARASFLLARQCGAAGLPAEARIVFKLAKSASDPQRSRGIDLALYETAASLLGWTTMGRLSAGIDALRL